LGRTAAEGTGPAKVTTTKVKIGDHDIEIPNNLSDEKPYFGLGKSEREKFVDNAVAQIKKTEAAKNAVPNMEAEIRQKAGLPTKEQEAATAAGKKEEEDGVLSKYGPYAATAGVAGLAGAAIGSSGNKQQTPPPQTQASYQYY
jgi:hypothetical protein